MTAVKEMLRKEPPQRMSWHGEVAVAPTDLSDRLSVIVPDFDPEAVWENCRWQARSDVALPAVGDSCLVIMSNRAEAWVVAWWPF